MRFLAAAVSTLLVIVYAAGSGVWVSQGDSWYRALTRPAWQPPDVVFGLVWPYNFAVLIAAGIAIAVTGTAAQRWLWLSALAVSVVGALAWAWLFYVEHDLWSAAACLLLATLATVPALVVAWRCHLWAGILLIPYLAWLAIATSLAVGYAARN
jgi:tryptophan-rich sensory protein